MDELGQSDQKYLTTISSKLTTRTLYEILTKVSGTKDVTLLGWKATDPNSKKGDSYLSVLYRFQIFGEFNNTNEKITIPVVAKGFPANLGRRKTYRSTDFFRNEINFYKIWDTLDKFHESKTSKKIDFVPKCLATYTDGENDFVILEDLSPLEFGSIKDRSKPLDVLHCKLIMRLFAKFHATSFAYKCQLPEEYKKLVANIEETYFAEKFRPWYQKFFKVLVDIWSDALEKEVPGSIYEKKFKDLIANDFYGKTCEVVKDNGKFSLLCEGDAWIMNVLLKYKDDIPTESILIDFQLARISSPATDLTFFLFACVDPSVRSQYWDEFLSEYHTAFAEQMEKLGSDSGLFTKQDLYDEFKKYGNFGIGMIEALPMTMVDDDEVQDLDTIQGDEAVDITTIWTLKLLKTKEKRMRLVSTVIEQVDRGFI